MAFKSLVHSSEKQEQPFQLVSVFMFSGPKRNCFDFISQTLQREITQNQGDVVLLLKAGNGLLDGREGAAGSDEIQVVIPFLP